MATATREYAQVVEALRGHCQDAADNPYNLMVTLLAAAVEAACRPETEIQALLRQYGFGPQTLTTWFQRADYDARQEGNYAVCLAAGYAALLSPVMGWSPDTLTFAMEQAQRFFFTAPDPRGKQAGVILRIVALKYAACRMFYYQIRHDTAERATAVEAALAELQAMISHLGTHATLTTFFARAQAQDEPLSLPEALRVIFTLPY